MVLNKKRFVFSLFGIVTTSIFAQNYIGNPYDGLSLDWGEVYNWDTETVPNSTSAIATFPTNTIGGSVTVPVNGNFSVDQISFTSGFSYNVALTGGSLTVGDGTESENILVTGGASYSLGTTIIPYSSSTTINVQVVGTESNFGKLYLLNDDIFPSDGSVSLNLSGTQGSFHPGAYSNTIGQLTGNGGLATVASGFLTINGGRS